jgi:hypothetical protein
MLLFFGNQTPAPIIIPTAPTPPPPAPVISFSASDFGARLRALIPTIWFGNNATVKTGIPATNGIQLSITEGLGSGLAFNYQQIQYARLQTRLATTTDTNLDQASLDYFAGALPRNLGESDSAYSTRIRLQIVSPLGTIPAITNAVKAYLNYNPGALQASIYQLFGLSTQGGLGTRGGLIAFTPAAIIVPQVYVFDQQSDPILSAKLGVAPPQFCVLLLYNAGKASGFFAGRSFAGRDYLVNAKLQLGPALTTALDTIVRATKAEGTIPLYGCNCN